MITIDLNQGNIKLYNDISQLPAERYKDFQKYQLMDSGLGSDMSSVDDRFSSLFKHLHRSNTADALKEVENLYFNHYLIIKGINMGHLSFGCLIYSINDDEITDYSEDALRINIKRASDLGLTQNILEAYLLDTKKNSDPN